MNAIAKKPPTAARKIRVILADDHPVVRDGLAAIVNQQADMQVVAEAGDGAEALELYETHQPDVMVLDMRLPDTNGIEILRQIRQDNESLPVIITTSYLSVEPQLRMLGLGYSGYLLKPFRLHELDVRIDAAS
jgi:DNA-binding NarL/FixJ family response regulator